MPEISVIVPIFNTGRILRKTINSIREQSFIDFECLLVDDGSEDSLTISICKEITLIDSRFKYFKKENEGIEKTRLYGVNKSNSLLLIFCDHDDYYEREAFRKLYTNYLKSDADIVCANCYKQRIQGSILTRSKNILGIDKEFIIDHDEFVRKYFLNFFGIHTFPVSTWGKLYKKSLFTEDLELYDINILEDIVLNIQLFDNAKKLHFISDFVYTHVYGGLSSEFNLNNAIDGYSAIYDFRKKYLNKYNLSVKPLLIEYKNIINQSINLMIDNNYRINYFQNLIWRLNKNDIFRDLLTVLTIEEQGNYIKFIDANDVESLYEASLANNTVGRKINHNIKKIVKRFI